MKQRLGRSARGFSLTWRYLFNLAPTLSYWLDRPALSGEAARVVADLNRDGVAITSAQALLGPVSCYGELCATVERLKLSLSEQLAGARAHADNLDAVGEKTFMVEYLGKYPVLDPDEIYTRFALQKNILQIANAYLGMYTRLRYYNVWQTFSTKIDARESQLWHRDREDRLILKMFVYLSDVDDGAGPFTYAPGSHPKGRLRREPAYFLEGHVKRSTDSQMADIIPPEQWIKGIGPKGTIIFADTRGYHKGGLARERDRLMYTCMFTSRASQSVEFLKREKSFTLPSDKAQAFALADPEQRAWTIWKLAR
jgi:hypothetical protein